MKRLWSKFTKWLNSDSVEERWAARPRKATRVLVELEGGEQRELTGEAADEWYHDLHRVNCGRRPDWSRHKWSITAAH